MRTRFMLALVTVASVACGACDDPGGESGFVQDGSIQPDVTSDTQSSDTGVAVDTSSPDIQVNDTGPADTGPADTGPADTGPADTGPADTGPADTGPADTGPADTGPADTTVEDTAPADVGTSACEASCPEVGVGPTGVTITNNASSNPPTLTGLAGDVAMSDLYELDSIAVYTKGAFDGVLISGATVADKGNTSGTVNFVDDHWAFYFDLDLSFTAQTVIGPRGGDSRNQIQGGGCFTLDGNDILSDTSACADGWPTGTTPPQQAEFTYDDASGLFTIKIVLSKEFVLALIPVEYQSLAESAIKGPITFIAKLSAAE